MYNGFCTYYNSNRRKYCIEFLEQGDAVYSMYRGTNIKYDSYIITLELKTLKKEILLLNRKEE